MLILKKNFFRPAFQIATRGIASFRLYFTSREFQPQNSYSHPMRIDYTIRNSSFPLSFRSLCTMPLSEFHDEADSTMDIIVDMLAPIEDALDDVDIVYSQGVITINLGSRGSWVINKQTPNRQIWWSSPKSGPRRYEYVVDETGEGGWYCTKSVGNPKPEDDLFYALVSEMLHATGIDITTK